MYISYTTPWSEGTVVAHLSDKSFAIGVDQTTGNMVRVNSIEELLDHDGIELTTHSNILQAIVLDTAWYPRDPVDPVEFEKYSELWKLEFQYINDQVL